LPNSAGSVRTFTSHFGVKTPVGGKMRFNVLHLDGHVDDSMWKDLPIYTDSWLLYMDDGGGWNTKRRPYGWWLKSNNSIGYKEYPEFEGAFDQNASEYRRVGR
jgi:prepilin-type processing-associated H-X9-DG protein